MTLTVQEYPGAPWEATVKFPISSKVWRKLLFFTDLPLLNDLTPPTTLRGSCWTKIGNLKTILKKKNIIKYHKGLLSVMKFSDKFIH
jgi:hypothetical protein